MNIYLSEYLCSDVGWEALFIKVFLIEYIFLLCKLISHHSQQKGNFSDDRRNKNWLFPLLQQMFICGGSQLNILGCIFYLDALFLDSEYILASCISQHRIFMESVCQCLDRNSVHSF